MAYIGMDVSKKLFPQGGALGQEITISGIPYKIIGVQTAKGTVLASLRIIS
ncbi:MAG: ABC transporter permease [Chloracidobacterium sp.]|nr:ABC transporter permease [Chloracidobacterium sp.]